MLTSVLGMMASSAAILDTCPPVSERLLIVLLQAFRCPTERVRKHLPW